MHPIHRLIDYALKENLIDVLDTDYVFNRLIYCLKVENLRPLNVYPRSTDATVSSLMEPILDDAVQKKLIEQDNTTERDLFEARVMDIFLSRPSDLQSWFDRLYAVSPQHATDGFYRLSQATNYIKTERIAKNKAFKVDSPYGTLDITINLSKPEKDPRAIRAALGQKSTNYPACLLCKEHVGHTGDHKQPPRANHRIIKVPLNNEPFYLQYSPYVYYNEHAIVLHEAHIPMEVGRHTFIRLIDFVDRFPHYFMGSNAGLPIVGGSILSHEHYQGGNADFPIDAAETFKTYEDENVTFKLLNWPLSVIRLSAKSRAKLIEAADSLRRFWLTYTDNTHGIVAKTDHPHNAITPIARKKNDVYMLDIALRNNLTSSAHPDGIFHPHSEHHHIKKENIGLIEVMGLAILPGRLDDDLAKIKDVLAKRITTFDNIGVYKPWITHLQSIYETQPIDRFIEAEVGKVFTACLEDCGVFKTDKHGRRGFETFMEAFFQWHSN